MDPTPAPGVEGSVRNANGRSCNVRRPRDAQLLPQLLVLAGVREPGRPERDRREAEERGDPPEATAGRASRDGVHDFSPPRAGRPRSSLSR